MLKKIFILSIVLAFILIGCTKNQTEIETIKIGAIFPLSGFISNFGASEKTVTEYAVREINSQGGINGQQIEIIYEDGGCDAKKSLAAAKKLIEFNQVDIILSGCSTETLTIASYARENNVLMFTSFSTSSHVSKHPNVFRTIINTKNNGIKLARLPSVQRLKRIVILAEENDYPIDLRDGLLEGLNNKNNILLEEFFALGTTNFQTQLTKIKSLNPDGIFIFAIDEKTGSLLTKQIRELGLETPIYGDIIQSSPVFLEIAGPAAEGIIFADLPIINEGNQKLQDILNYFNQQNIKPIPNYYLAARYDSIYLIKNALESCSQDNNCIADYLRNNQHHGLLGDYGFDQNGDLTVLEVSFKQIINGKPQTYEYEN